MKAYRAIVFDGHYLFPVGDLGAHYASIENKYRIGDGCSELKVKKLLRKSAWAMRSCHIEAIDVIFI